ncbi:MAG: inositol monophosphatase family protein, partial [Chloroflexota bacterium]
MRPNDLQTFTLSTLRNKVISLKASGVFVNLSPEFSKEGYNRRMNADNTPTLIDLEILARQAGEILRGGYAKKHQVDHKGIIDLVTEIDHQSEDLILNGIRARFPGHAILAEESGRSEGFKDQIWFVDPLDGTVNYAHNIPLFCVSIAYAHNGLTRQGVVYDPMRDECFSAERGRGARLNGTPLHASTVTELVQGLLVTGFPYDTWDTSDDNFENITRFAKMTQGVRRLGSAALDLAYVAAGRFDGYWEISLAP